MISDTLYINNDIDTSYCYAEYGNYYIDLYNRERLTAR